MTCTASSVERSRSVSSMRRMNLPPAWRAYSQREQRRADAADVQQAGRAGGKAGDDVHMGRASYRRRRGCAIGRCAADIARLHFRRHRRGG